MFESGHVEINDGHMFNAQVKDLSQNNTLVRIDLRSHGQSSLRASDTYRHCDDVAATLTDVMAAGLTKPGSS